MHLDWAAVEQRSIPRTPGVAPGDLPSELANEGPQTLPFTLLHSPPFYKHHGYSVPLTKFRACSGIILVGQVVLVDIRDVGVGNHVVVHVYWAGQETRAHPAS